MTQKDTKEIVINVIGTIVLLGLLLFTLSKLITPPDKYEIDMWLIDFNSGILGRDEDKNGIRDDIDLWLENNPYAVEDENIYNAYVQAYKAITEILEYGLKDEKRISNNDAAILMYNYSIGSSCFYYFFYKKRREGQLIPKIKDIILNDNRRFKIYDDAFGEIMSRTGGTFYRSSAEDCNFQIQKEADQT